MRLSILEGEFECCGTLCDRHKVQQHIDRMQAVINTAYTYLANPIAMSPDKLEELFEELEDLKDEEV